MIDSHCHLCHMENVDEIIEEAKLKGVDAIVTSALGRERAEKSFAIRERHPDSVFVCTGLHPSEAGKPDEEEYMDFIRKNSKNIVAIGETGLDYNRVTDKGKQEASKAAFLEMIKLAGSLDLPLVIHTRNGPKNENAVADALAILKENGAKRVMMHCFSGSESDLKEALGMGYLISYATNICWTKKHPRLAEKTPLEQMVLETDAPWLDPDSVEEKKLENRPWKIEKSAEVIAKIKGVTKEEVLKITEENARRFFGLEKYAQGY